MTDRDLLTWAEQHCWEPSLYLLVPLHRDYYLRQYRRWQAKGGK